MSLHDTIPPIETSYKGTLDTIWEKEICLQRSEEFCRTVQSDIEIHIKALAKNLENDQKPLINDMVNAFLSEHTFLQIVGNVGKTAILPVGSAYEGTKNHLPDEFDFIFVVQTFSGNGCIREFSDKTFNDLHEAIKQLLGRNKSYLTDSDLPMLKLKNLSRARYVTRRGPSSKLCFTYSDIEDNSLEICVDFVPAYKIVDFDVNDSLDVPIKEFHMFFASIRSILLVRDTISYTEQEAKFTKELPAKHKKAYQLVKYLINGHDDGDKLRERLNGYSEDTLTRLQDRKRITGNVIHDIRRQLTRKPVITSYMIKLAMIKHHFSCDTKSEGVRECVIAMLQDIRKSIKLSVLECNGSEKPHYNPFEKVNLKSALQEISKKLKKEQKNGCGGNDEIIPAATKVLRSIENDTGGLPLCCLNTSMKEVSDRRMMKLGEHQRSGITLSLIYHVMLCVLGGGPFLCGYSIGILKTYFLQTIVHRDRNRKEPLYTDDKSLNSSNSPVTESEEGEHMQWMWLISLCVYYFGSFVTLLWIKSRSRKMLMLISSVLLFICVMFNILYCSSSANNFNSLMALLVFYGQLNELSSVACVYLAEISPKKIRGAVGTCNKLFFTIGCICSMVFGLQVVNRSWSPFAFLFPLIMVLVCQGLIFSPFSQESPRHLLNNKKDQDGAKEVLDRWGFPTIAHVSSALQKLRGRHYDIEDEYTDMIMEANYSSKGRIDNNRRTRAFSAIMTATILFALQMFSANEVIFYENFYFKPASITDKSVPYAMLIMEIIHVLCAICCMPLIEKLGRRLMLIYSMIVMVLSLGVVTFCFFKIQPGTLQEHSTWTTICVIAFAAYSLSFALGLGPVSLVVVSEILSREALFTQKFIGSIYFACSLKYMTLFVSVTWFVFWRLISEPALYFIVSFVILLFSTIVVVLFVPETKDKTFIEIGQLIGRNQCRPRRRYRRP